jgi:uncharacterized membrane protein (DUF106 family)
MSGVVEVLLWTLGLSLLLAIIYRVLTKPDEARRLKQNMKEVQARLKKAQKSGDMDSVNALTSEMLKGSQKQFSMNMKPMIVSMIMFLVFLNVIGAQYEELAVLLPIPFLATSWEFPFLVITKSYSWFWWYIIITLPSTFFFRKLLGVE